VNDGLDTVGPAPPERVAGRRRCIEDGALRGSRDRLLSLFNATWADVGLSLQLIKKSTDVREALSVWEADRDNRIVRLLLSSNVIRVPVKNLRTMSRKLIELSESVRTVTDERFRIQQSVELADQALAMTSDVDRDRIDRIRNDLVKTLSAANARLDEKTREHKETQEALENRCAHFAQSELTDFCLSQRYKGTPLSVANALAGLPYIGWRRSMSRCSKWSVEDFGGGPYKATETISRIVQSCQVRSELIASAEQWLRAKSPTKSRAITELRESWYYLKEALKSVLQEPKISRRALPFRIVQVYYRMKQHPSPADLLLAEHSRIV
jgi:hypothetical protein